jgi:hypothetical protein
VDKSIGEYLKVLPKIADHPLAIVAYICLVAAALLWFFRRSKSNDFLKALDRITASKREEFCQNAGYKYDELSHLPPKDRLKRLMLRDRLIAILAIVIAVTLLGIESIQELRRENHTQTGTTPQTIQNNGTISAPIQNAIGNSNAQTINH